LPVRVVGPTGGRFAARVRTVGIFEVAADARETDLFRGQPSFWSRRPYAPRGSGATAGWLRDRIQFGLRFDDQRR
jgi:hypothetical protein